MEYDIESILEMYEDDYNPGPRPMAQAPRNMYNQGQLVSNTVDGSRPGYSGREYSSKEFDKFSDDVLKAYAEDDITKMIDPKYKSNINRVKINKYNNLNKLIEKTGLDEETIFNLFDDREAYVELEQKQATTQGRPVEKGKAKFYKQAENWIVKNSKRYADPDKFKKAFIRTFGKDNDIIQKINKPEVLGKRNSTLTSVPFSDWFRTNIMGSSEQAMKGQVKPSYSGKQLNQIFKTAIYTNNENVRNKIINELTNILPEKGSKRTPDIRKKFQSSNILKKFGLNEKIDGPIARLLAKEVGDDLLKQVSLFRKPFLGTTQLINYLKDRVNPKYKSMFEEAAKATAFAQKNSWPQARQALNSSNSIMFDHKIPKALIEAGYADEVEYIKLNPASAEFNAKIKNSQFDKPMIKLTNEFERTKSLDGKAKVVEKMNILKNNFSKKYGGYLNEVSIIPNKTGKPIFKSSAAPVTKQTDLVSSLGKSMFQAGEINQKQLASLLEKLGCGKSAGGRIKFGKGTTCAIKGRDILEKGLKNGFKKSDVGLAQKILGSGKFLKDAVSLRGLLGPAALAFTAAAEAGLVGYDMLSTGKSFKEAVGSSVFNYMLGDKTKIDEVEERDKRMIAEGMTPEQMGKIKYMESMMGDMQTGSKNYNTIKDLEKKIEDNTLNQQVNPKLFPDQAFQLNTQLDKAQAENQDYFRTNKVGELENYFTPKEDGTIPFLGGMQTLTEGLARNELAQLQSVDNPLQSRKGDEKRAARMNELMLQYPELGPKYDFMEGGIASLNVNKK